MQPELAQLAYFQGSRNDSVPKRHENTSWNRLSSCSRYCQSHYIVDDICLLIFVVGAASKYTKSVIQPQDHRWICKATRHRDISAASATVLLGSCCHYCWRIKTYHRWGRSSWQQQFIGSRVGWRCGFACLCCPRPDPDIQAYHSTTDKDCSMRECIEADTFANIWRNLSNIWRDFCLDPILVSTWLDRSI